MAVSDVWFYEGADHDNSGYCLCPEGVVEFKAPVVIVFTYGSGTVFHTDVPVREEGGGHTIRSFE